MFLVIFCTPQKIRKPLDLMFSGEGMVKRDQCLDAGCSAIFLIKENDFFGIRSSYKHGKEMNILSLRKVIF